MVNGDIYDTNDIIYPSLEPNAIFITTSFIVTANQTRNECTPSAQKGIKCVANSDCPALNSYIYSPTEAISTETCNQSQKLCTVKTWCPIENEAQKNVISNIGNGTVSFDIQTMFPSFANLASEYNTFVIDEIVGNATNHKRNTNNITETGIIILLMAEWHCDLDLDIKSCVPTFQYYTIANEFNVRNVWYTNGDLSRRTLMNRYGIRIVFVAIGNATKTSVHTFIFLIGLGIISVIASIVFSYYVWKGLPLICRFIVKSSEKEMATDTAFMHDTDDGMSFATSPSVVLEGKSHTLMGHSTQM